MATSNVKPLRSVYQQHYKAYVDVNLQPRPIDPGSKKCSFKGWQNDLPTVHDGKPPPKGDYGLGLRLGTRLSDGSFLVAIDADHDEFVRLAESDARASCCSRG